jgi:hypothetical protein
MEIRQLILRAFSLFYFKNLEEFSRPATIILLWFQFGFSGGPGAIGSGTLFLDLETRQLILRAKLIFSPVQESLLVV